jgi:hypothetical protein
MGWRVLPLQPAWARRDSPLRRSRAGLWDLDRAQRQPELGAAERGLSHHPMARQALPDESDHSTARRAALGAVLPVRRLGPLRGDHQGVRTVQQPVCRVPAAIAARARAWSMARLAPEWGGSPAPLGRRLMVRLVPVLGEEVRRSRHWVPRAELRAPLVLPLLGLVARGPQA